MANDDQVVVRITSASALVAGPDGPRRVPLRITTRQRSLPVERMPLWVRRILAMLTSSPAYGRCGRCGICWRFDVRHTTWHGTEGTFVLCRGCWRDLAPKERLPYYQATFDRTRADLRRLVREGLIEQSVVLEHDASWEAISEAVLAGR